MCRDSFMMPLSQFKRKDLFPLLRLTPRHVGVSRRSHDVLLASVRRPTPDETRRLFHNLAHVSTSGVILYWKGLQCSQVLVLLSNQLPEPPGIALIMFTQTGNKIHADPIIVFKFLVVYRHRNGNVKDER